MKARNWIRPSRLATEHIGFEELSVELTGEQPGLTLQCSLRISARSGHAKSFMAADISDSTGTVIMQALPHAAPFIPGAPGSYDLVLEISLPPLIPGAYWLSFWLGPHNTETYDFVQKAVSFEVVENPTPGRMFPHTADHGYIVPKSRCKVIRATHIAECCA